MESVLHMYDWLCKVQLPFHKMPLKAVKSSWGIISPAFFFWFPCASQKGFSHLSVLPLRVSTLFSASPPAWGENSSPSRGRWKVWLSVEVSLYAFWLFMMGSGATACDHLTLLTSHLPVCFLCQRKFFVCFWVFCAAGFVFLHMT